MSAPPVRFEKSSNGRGFDAWTGEFLIGEVWPRHSRSDWGWRVRMDMTTIGLSNGHTGTRNGAKRCIREAWRKWYARHGQGKTF